MLYLLAGNGGPNFGDELIVQGWLRYYREIGYAGGITVDGKGHESTAKLLKDVDGVRFVSHIPRHAEGLGETYFDFNELGRNWASRNWTSFKDTTGFHFVGGGYAAANWVNATRMLSAVVWLGRILSVPVVATGLGISPFKRIDDADRTAWRDILKGFRMIECRDQDSYADLKSLAGPAASQVSLGLDDAFLYPVSRSDHPGRWLHLSGFSDNAILSSMDENTRVLFSNFDKIVFWLCAKPDRKVYLQLKERFPQIIGWSNDQLINEGIPIGQRDFMITSRFHPHLQAARCGIAGYYLAQSPFYKTKHGLVTDLGSPFKRFQSTGELFESTNSNMVEVDPQRVIEKRKVARNVLKVLTADA